MTRTKGSPNRSKRPSTNSRIAALEEHLNAMNHTVVTALAEVKAAKAAIRENIELKQALAETQVTLRQLRTDHVCIVNDLELKIGVMDCEKGALKHLYKIESDNNAILREKVAALTRTLKVML